MGTTTDPNLTTTVIVPASGEAATIARNGSGEIVTVPSIIRPATPAFNQREA